MVGYDSPPAPASTHTITLTQLSFIIIIGGYMRWTGAGGFVPPVL